MHGGAGEDLMNGNEGNDRLFGDDGDDVMWGGPHHDHLWGGWGDDYLDVRPRPQTTVRADIIRHSKNELMKLRAISASLFLVPGGGAMGRSLRPAPSLGSR